MSLIFKLFGAAIALASAGVVSRKYSEHLGYRAALVRELYSLLSHIKNKISVYLAPPSELMKGFWGEALSRAGFISLAEELGSPKDAYIRLRASLPLSDAVRRTLDGYFEHFGASYKDELIRESEIAERSLKEAAEAAEAQLPQERKLSRTVIFAIALGAVILFF